MKISKKITKLRKELKLTAAEFGEKIGVTGRMVSRWENDTSKPTDEQIKLIKEKYNVDLLEETVKKTKKEHQEVIVKTPAKLNEKDAKGLKILSKIIYVIAKILKVLLIISIPFLICLMVIIPAIVNNIEVGDNYLKYKTPSGDVLTVEGENLSLSGKYNIRYKDQVTSEEIQYDVLGQIVKNLKEMDKTKIIVYSETIIVLGIAGIILEIVFFTYLSNLFKNIYDKTPFTEKNINYLSKMTNILVINIIVTFLFEFIVNNFINYDIRGKFSLDSILVIMIVASLMYIFKYGYNLQKQVKSDIY